MPATTVTSPAAPVGVSAAGLPMLGTPGAPKMEKDVITRWFADKGDTTLRVTYPLSKDSVVLDVGGYEGNWAAQVDEKYGCAIHVFEPVPAFAENIRQRFAGKPNIHVHAFGVAEKTDRCMISLGHDRTSIHQSTGNTVEIQLRSAAEVLPELGLGGRTVDLMKINIEGCEFELLEHLMTTGLVKQIRDIQVQFHDFVPDASARMEAIQKRLTRTHELAWQYRFVWENWHRREA